MDFVPREQVEVSLGPEYSGINGLTVLNVDKYDLSALNMVDMDFEL